MPEDKQFTAAERGSLRDVLTWFQDRRVRVRMVKSAFAAVAVIIPLMAAAWTLYRSIAGLK